MAKFRFVDPLMGERRHYLIAASEKGNIEHVNKILIKLDIRQGDIDEGIQELLNQSLLAASTHGHTYIVGRLLSVGAQVNWHDSCFTHAQPDQV